MSKQMQVGDETKMADLQTKRATTKISIILSMVVLAQIATAGDGTIFAEPCASTFTITGTASERANSPATEIGPARLDDQCDSASADTPVRPSRVGQNWLLVIGIDKYSQWPQLQNSVRDAKAIRDILLEHYRFDRQFVIELYNEQATRENIIKSFEDLARRVEADDNVLVYYAGHGEYDQTFKRGYWIPFDASTHTTAQHLPGTDLQAFLGAIRSRSILVISDACFSGTLFPGGMKSLTLETTRAYLLEVAKLKARQALISGGDEPVMDGGVFIDQHSIFAHYLIDRLGKNRDKYLTASSLYEQIKDPVSSKSLQSPECNAIQNAGDEGGEFLFVRE